MSLINMNNFFSFNLIANNNNNISLNTNSLKNTKTENETKKLKSEKLIISKGSDFNYIMSLFLTASAMTQSRHFIQAWEFFNKIQTILLNSNDDILIILDIIFRNFSFNKNYFSLKTNKNNKNSFSAKIELLKSMCLFEQGHTQPFLDSLQNVINIYYLGEYNFNCNTSKLGINWSKINDFNSDKFTVQNFLNKNGKKLVEFLIVCLNYKCEILVITSLKIIEYIIDYLPSVITSYFSKIIKCLLRMIYPICNINKQLDPKRNILIEGIEYSDFFNYLMKNKEVEDFLQIFSINDIYFTKDLLLKFININYNEEKSINFNSNNNNNYNYNYNYNNNFNNNINNNNLSSSMSLSSSYIGNKNYNLSSILIKQVNYILDTIICNIDNLCFGEVNNIFIKLNRLLIEILKYDLDCITQVNIIKLIKKIYENLNSQSDIINQYFNKNSSSSSEIDKYFNELISAMLTISVNPKIFYMDISEISKRKKNLRDSISENSSIKFQSEKNYNLNNNSKNNNNHHDEFNSNNSYKFFEIFENSDKSITILFAIKKLLELNIINNNKENSNIENLNWIKLNIEIILKFIKNNINNFLKGSISNNNISNNNKTSNNLNIQLNDFCIFYLFLNLKLLKIFYLEKDENKVSDLINSKVKNKLKYNIQFSKSILGIMNSLIELEGICLQIKDCFFIFDFIMEIFLLIKEKFGNFFNFNFNKIFIPQLEALKNRINHYGIFKENTFFLIKTLPFIDLQNLENNNDININNTNNNNYKINFNEVEILKEIFEIILKNFSNFYDEDIFIVYNILLDKLSNNLNEDLISKIVNSIVFKYNYKGNNFKNSSKMLFEILLNNLDYFKILKNDLIKSSINIFSFSNINNSNDRLNKEIFYKLNVNSNNNNHCYQMLYEYFEKLEFYKKFLEFIKEDLKGMSKFQIEIFDILLYFTNEPDDFIEFVIKSSNETVKIINFDQYFIIHNTYLLNFNIS
jgi:hypothetical protein